MPHFTPTIFTPRDVTVDLACVHARRPIYIFAKKKISPLCNPCRDFATLVTPTSSASPKRTNSWKQKGLTLGSVTISSPFRDKTVTISSRFRDKIVTILSRFQELVLFASKSSSFWGGGFEVGWAQKKSCPNLNPLLNFLPIALLIFNLVACMHANVCFVWERRVRGAV